MVMPGYQVLLPDFRESPCCSFALFLFTFMKQYCCEWYMVICLLEYIFVLSVIINIANTQVQSRFLVVSVLFNFFCLVSFVFIVFAVCLVCLMLPMSMHCLFLVSPLAFSEVYLTDFTVLGDHHILNIGYFGFVIFTVNWHL